MRQKVFVIHSIWTLCLFWQPRNHIGASRLPEQDRIIGVTNFPTKSATKTESEMKVENS